MSAICGCSFVRDILNKYKEGERISKEDRKNIFEHILGESPCYWCGYDYDSMTKEIK